MSDGKAIIILIALIMALSALLGYVTNGDCYTTYSPALEMPVTECK